MSTQGKQNGILPSGEISILNQVEFKLKQGDRSIHCIANIYSTQLRACMPFDPQNLVYDLHRDGSFKVYLSQGHPPHKSRVKLMDIQPEPGRNINDFFQDADIAGHDAAIRSFLYKILTDHYNSTEPPSSPGNENNSPLLAIARDSHKRSGGLGV